MTMIRRIFIAALLCASFTAQALTTQQLATLKAAIAAETNPTFIALRQANETGQMADWYNLNTSPAFVVWKSNVSISAVGDKINGTELAGLSSLNTTRLNVVIALSPSGVNPSLTDRRAFFDDIFSGTGGVNTRANLLALWKRTARNIEKVFATGTGSDASPATLGFDGTVSNNDILAALAS